MTTREQNKIVMMDQIDTVRNLAYKLRPQDDRMRLEDIKTLKYHIRQLSKYVRDVESDTLRVVENMYP